MRPSQQVFTAGTTVPAAATAGTRTLPNTITLRANRIYRVTGMELFMPTNDTTSFASLTLEDPNNVVVARYERRGAGSFPTSADQDAANDNQHGVGIRIAPTADTVYTAYCRLTDPAALVCAGLVHVEVES